ncbi:MAG: hypothetical protein HFG08_01550 [Oscillibacter sp.]|nr:hypothetical protein [Oscillibacter sp.]
MGHADVSTTLRIYTHLDAIHKRKSVDKLDDYLSGQPGGKEMTCKSDASQKTVQLLVSVAMSVPFKQWVRGSNPRRVTSSEIPIIAPFPPYGEDCAIMGISSLSAEIRSAGLSADFCKKGTTGAAGGSKKFSYVQSKIFERGNELLQNQIRRNLMVERVWSQSLRLSRRLE